MGSDIAPGHQLLILLFWRPTTLFPDKPYLATRTPHPSNFDSHSQPTSSHAKYAARALHRLQSKTPPILEALSPSSTENRSRTSRGLQHAISSLVDEADATLTLEAIKQTDCPSYPWRTALHISNRGCPYLSHHSNRLFYIN